MKYIIELPEEVKEKFDNATKDEIYGSYYDYNSVIGNAIKNGTPLEEELEKIKADFEELANDEWNIQVGASKGLECAIDVIEDRIAEMKGE